MKKVFLKGLFSLKHANLGHSNNPIKAFRVNGNFRQLDGNFRRMNRYCLKEKAGFPRIRMDANGVSTTPVRIG